MTAWRFVGTVTAFLSAFVGGYLLSSAFFEPKGLVWLLFAFGAAGCFYNAFSISRQLHRLNREFLRPCLRCGVGVMRGDDTCYVCDGPREAH
jgi:hypothetical protein